ncbi:MAG: glycosyltransferase family 39 protein [Betaproteobacteria bacterium]|nr:glycosyltransferase family 39 protein [Betaproteobacteria bacterium]
MSRAALRLLAVALALAWFGTLGWRPLMRADEARYAEIAREMVASGDWVTPRLNGFKYFEKPPLQYWATATAFELFGVRDWVSRLWPALTGFAGLVLVLFAGRRLFGAGAGAYAAAVLAGSPLYVLLGQFDTLDMGVTFFLSLAVLAYALAQREEAPPLARRRWMLTFWTACALATLSKGLIGIVLPGGAIALDVLLRRDWRRLAHLSWGAGLPLFLVVAVPWFALVSARNPEFFHFFFIQEHFERFLTRYANRYEPAWYFVPVLAFGMGPWLLALVPAFLRAWRGVPRRFSPQRFLALWALVVFVFFSASDSKLASYILPIFPALALLVGDYLAAERPRALLVAQGALLAAGGALLAALAPWLMREEGGALAELLPAYVPWVVAAGAVVGLGGLAALALAWRARAGAAVGALALAGFAGMLIALLGHRTLAPYYSTAQLVAEARPQLDPRAPFYAVEAYDHTLPWYLRRTVTMVGYKDELAEAIGWEPQKFLPDPASFARAWRADRHAGALFATRDLAAFRRQYDLPMQIVARGARYTIVRKP